MQFHSINKTASSTSSSSSAAPQPTSTIASTSASSTTPSTTEKSHSSHTPVIVGVVVGIGGAIIIATVIIAFLLLRSLRFAAEITCNLSRKVERNSARSGQARSPCNRKTRAAHLRSLTAVSGMNLLVLKKQLVIT